MRAHLFYVALFCSVIGRELHLYDNIINFRPEKVCQNTQRLRESVHQDVISLVNNSILPELLTRQQLPCSCGGLGWRKVAYLNMSDTTQTCPQAWELITTPKRSCGRPSNVSYRPCYSATFSTPSTPYSKVCGRLIGYQFGQPEAFLLETIGQPQTIDDPYVDGVSVTYGNPRQHIWTFAVALDETSTGFNARGGCPCTRNNSENLMFNVTVPSFLDNDYFCETGVPLDKTFNHNTFYADDPLWDGQGCGPMSTCCSFNNPPWFCKQLPRPTTADLEIRLCGVGLSRVENTPIELVEIYTS